ncbi:MAG: DUF4493 domain-containing protein [Alistipes sp.]|nr:DUF4493 domain-containing protein [Alistipes sp.]
MKFVKFTVAALFTALLAVGCADENITFEDKGVETLSDKGYLSISNLVVDCRVDDKDPNMGVEPSTYATRNSVDVNNFDCSIINDEGEVVSSFKLGERPAEALELKTGDYIFKVKSGEIQGAAWNSPVYGATKVFKIVRDETTTISEVVCSLMQIKVSITYAPDLLERLGEGTTTTAIIGENSLAFSLTETRDGYFSAPQVSNTITLNIKGTYAADKVTFKSVEMNKEVKDVKVGQHSKIHFYIEHANEGNIKVSVTLRDWVTDEVIPCNVADLVTEEEWTEGGNEGGDDPGTTVGAPDIIWAGYDMSKRYAITGDLTVDLEIVAEKGIKELLCEIKSEVLTPDQLSGVGLCNILNLCYPKQSYDSSTPSVYVDVEQPLRDLDFSVAEEVLNKKKVNLSITKFLGILQGVSGASLKNHDFILSVTDNDGVTTVKTLMLQTGN